MWSATLVLLLQSKLVVLRRLVASMGVEVTVVQQGGSLPAGVRMWSVLMVRLVLWQLGASMGVEVTAVQCGSSLPPEYHMGSAGMELRP